MDLDIQSETKYKGRICKIGKIGQAVSFKVTGLDVRKCGVFIPWGWTKTDIFWPLSPNLGNYPA